MDAVITVACRRDDHSWLCDVSVTEDESQSRHEVKVSNEELVRYGRPEGDVELLVDQSFRFLLAREPKESILGRFALSDIERYFPEFREQASR